VLLGVTGSGKTFTIANVIKNVNRPTLVISHNKTLAAQLYAEFKAFFPHNAVEYFVSYFDYYQPEAYIPRTDTFIEKDSSVNEAIERMRLSTMSALHAARRAGGGERVVHLRHREQGGLRVDGDPSRGRHGARASSFSCASWTCNTTGTTSTFERGKFPGARRHDGGVPGGREDALRMEFFGDEIDRITRFDPLTGEVLEQRCDTVIFPGKQFVTPPTR
jgi:excinuclease ABC subunit B